MANQDAYIALMTSLPSSERLFIAKQPPLTRLRLDRRLAQLAAEDRRILAVIENVLSWSAYAMEDTANLARARFKDALRQVPQRTLRQIIKERMDVRTAVAALRLRRDGASAAPTGVWGFGRWTGHIAAHWSDPTFKLDTAMPWLDETRKLLDTRDPLELERHLLKVTFHQLQRHAAHHPFDFEGVVIYVLKWNIFDRWAQADPDVAARRFSALATDALRDFPDVILEGEAS